MNIIDKISTDYKDILDIVIEECIKQKIEVYLVGGAIRDIVLNRSPKDIDICIEANPMDIIKNLKGIKNYSYFEKFQTSNIVFNNGLSIDLIRCRKEYYKSNGALPKVTPSHIYDDLYRRDFTINSIAYDLINKIYIDPYRGMEDIKKKIIREVHENSYYEDPTRIFRAIKYANRYNFSLSDENAIKECLHSNIFDCISNDRFIKELVLICSEDCWKSNIITMSKFGILQINEKIMGTSNSLCNYSEVENRILYLFISLIGEKNIDKFIDNSILNKELRFAFKNHKNTIINITNILNKTITNFQIFEVFNNLNQYQITLLSFQELFKYKAINYLKCRKNDSLKINGSYLEKIGLKKGKQYKLILNYLLYIKFNTGILDDIKYFHKNIEEILHVAKYKD